MNSDETLAWPTAWGKLSRSTGVILTVCFGLLTVVGLTVSVATSLQGDPARGMALLFGVPFLALATVLVYLHRVRWPRGVRMLRSESHGDFRERAVVIPYARAIHLLNVVSMTCAVVFFGAIALSGGVVARTAGMTGGGIVLAVLSGLLTAYAAWFLLEVVRGKIRNGSVALSPTGVYHRSWAMWGFFPWEDIVEVRAMRSSGLGVQLIMTANAKGELVRTSSAWRQSEMNMAPHMMLRAKNLAVDPAVVYHGMRFYKSNDSLRHELATEEGVSRLQQLRLET